MHVRPSCDPFIRQLRSNLPSFGRSGVARLAPQPAIPAILQSCTPAWRRHSRHTWTTSLVLLRLESRLRLWTRMASHHLIPATPVTNPPHPFSAGVLLHHCLTAVPMFPRLTVPAYALVTGR